jgi:hypothetical protein
VALKEVGIRGASPSQIWAPSNSSRNKQKKITKIKIGRLQLTPDRSFIRKRHDQRHYSHQKTVKKTP